VVRGWEKDREAQHCSTLALLSRESHGESAVGSRPQYDLFGQCKRLQLTLILASSPPPNHAETRTTHKCLWISE